jgi:hypothetical protein
MCVCAIWCNLQQPQQAACIRDPVYAQAAPLPRGGRGSFRALHTSIVPQVQPLRVPGWRKTEPRTTPDDLTLRSSLNGRTVRTRVPDRNLTVGVLMGARRRCNDRL